ncbi:MAG TPA: hypothetical protein VMU51_29800 [Mycobacteriales bacterium]|nr:hypothetical protein [Mycobacteriales bacterium]
MRRLGRTAVTTAGALALLAGAIPAAQAIVVPDTHCESGASRFVCDANLSHGPTDWTLTINWRGGPPPSVIPIHTDSNFLNGNCSTNTISYLAKYTYVDSAGVTRTAAQAVFRCNPGDWP